MTGIKEVVVKEAEADTISTVRIEDEIEEVASLMLTQALENKQQLDASNPQVAAALNEAINAMAKNLAPEQSQTIDEEALRLAHGWLASIVDNQSVADLSDDAMRRAIELALSFMRKPASNEGRDAFDDAEMRGYAFKFLTKVLDDKKTIAISSAGVTNALRTGISAIHSIISKGGIITGAEFDQYQAAIVFLENAIANSETLNLSEPVTEKALLTALGALSKNQSIAEANSREG